MQKDKILTNSKIVQKVADFFFNRKKYLVFCPSAHNIGHLVQELIIASSKCKEDKKKLVIIKPYESCNSEILETNSNEIGIIRSGIRVFLLTLLLYLLSIYFKIKNFVFKILKKLFLNKIFNFDHNSYPVCLGFEANRENLRKIIGSKYYYDYNLMKKRPKFLLTPKQNNKAKKLLEKLSIDKNQWYACLHLREGNYAGYSEVRNCSLEHYIPTINFINSIGGKVIKMGNKSMQKAPENVDLLDYATSENKSDLLDLYLINNCKLFIGTNSGLGMLAYLLKKDVINVNFHDFIGAFFGNSKGTLFKNFYLKPEKKKISPLELINSNEYKDYIVNLLDNKSTNLIVEENTAEQILDTIKNFFENKNLYDLNLNSFFKEDKIKVHKKILKEKNISPIMLDYIEGIMEADTNVIF